MKHICGECYQDAADHPTWCAERECSCSTPAVSHRPPLCCPGCPCGSYEEAHSLPTPYELAAVVGGPGNDTDKEKP